MQPRSEDLFTFLANSLDRARQEALKLPADKRGMVELEARLGVFASKSFEIGVKGRWLTPVRRLTGRDTLSSW